MSRGNFRFPVARATLREKSRVCAINRDNKEEIFSREFFLLSRFETFDSWNNSIKWTNMKSRDGFIVEKWKEKKVVEKRIGGEKVSLRSYLISAGIQFLNLLPPPIFFTDERSIIAFLEKHLRLRSPIGCRSVSYILDKKRKREGRRGFKT